MYATFNRFEIQMTRKQAQAVSHSGDCQADVELLHRVPAIRRQLARITDEQLQAELFEYGAWDTDELQDRRQNEVRILWLAGNDIMEA